MNIMGVLIKIKKGKCGAGDIVLRKGLLRGADIYATEKKIRNFCTTAFKNARKKRSRGLRLFVERNVSGVFPCVAIAKIFAQEIYRCAKEDRPVFKSVHIVLEEGKDFKVFDKTITGYLRHLLEDLTQGPFLTVDTIIEVKGGIVLIKRSNPPFGWALPGGFLDYGESLEDAACREAYEETGLRVRDLRQMHTYSRPGRDPRFQTVTTVFTCRAKGTPRAGSDAREARIFNPAALKSLHLAFDHAKILSDYLRFKSLRPRCLFF